MPAVTIWFDEDVYEMLNFILSGNLGDIECTKSKCVGALIRWAHYKASEMSPKDKHGEPDPSETLFDIVKTWKDKKGLEGSD